ncbi:MAG TPA: hypothetical protein VHD90_02205 [Phototrophicaceae bacterium]|nr:hypothetical protein [Phototrophicaceae bacterium]
MKNIRTLLIFAMIFVVLALLLYVQSKQAPSVIVATPTVGQSVAQLFPDLTLDEIQAVQLNSPETGKTFTISRAADGSWTAPINPGKLSQIASNDIAKTMVLLPFSQTMMLKPGDDKSSYGFTPKGVLQIEIILTNGVSHAVEIGYRTPTQDGYYALVDDLPNLYLMERPAIDYLISTLRSPPVA